MERPVKSPHTCFSFREGFLYNPVFDRKKDDESRNSLIL